MAAEALQPVETAATVRVRNGKVSVTDGPFAETKEQLAGFYLIDARDLNEAINVAAKIPPAREGQRRSAAGPRAGGVKRGSRLTIEERRPEGAPLPCRSRYLLPVEDEGVLDRLPLAVHALLRRR